MKGVHTPDPYSIQLVTNADSAQSVPGVMLHRAMRAQVCPRQACLQSRHAQARLACNHHTLLHSRLVGAPPASASAATPAAAAAFTTAVAAATLASRDSVSLPPR